jgi:MFS family permease
MYARSLIILTSLVVARITFGYQFQTIASLAPALMSQFGLTYTALGSLIGSYMILGAFTALPLGLLGRRLGEGPVLTAGLLLMTGGACVSAFASTAAGIGFGRAAAGFGAVAMIVLQNKIIAEWFRGRMFMIAISATVCAFPVGMGLAGLVQPPVVTAFGIHAALFTCALPAGFASLLFGLSYREPPQPVAIPRRFSLPTTRECLLLVVAGLTWMTYTAGFSGFVSYLPAALALRGFSIAFIGLVLAIAMWGNAIGTLSGGGLATRVGQFSLFLFGTVSLVAGMVGLAANTWLIVSAFVMGVLGSLQPGVVMAAATLSARPENRAVGMGIFYTIYYAGGALVPTICGMAADYAGTPSGGLWAGAGLSMAAIPTFLLHRILSARQPVLVQA